MSMLPDEPSQSIINGQTRTPTSSSPKRAKNRTKKAPELHTLERRNWLIHLHYIRKEFQKCKEVIQLQLRETHNMCEYANYVLGLILRQEGKIQESLEQFQVCNVLNPSSADNIKQMARSLFLLGRHRLAIEAYRQAESRIDSGDWEIYHNLGVCYTYLKEWDQAIQLLRSALNESKHEETYIVLGKVHLYNSDIQSALEVYKQAVHAFPEHGDLNTTLGLLYIQTGNHQAAFEHLGTALAFDPKNSKAILAAGSMMQSHQDYDVALSKYKLASHNIPESAPLWNNIGMCFFGKKKFVASISCLKRANYLAPFDWKILYNLASINLRPSRGQTFMLMAIALDNLEDAENATAAYEQAIALDQRDPGVVLNFAIYLSNHKDVVSAARQLKEFESRVEKLREIPGLDVDPEILRGASILAANIGYTLSVSLQNEKQKLDAIERGGGQSRGQRSTPSRKGEPTVPIPTEPPRTAAAVRSNKELESEVKARVRSARSAMKQRRSVSDLVNQASDVPIHIVQSGKPPPDQQQVQHGPEQGEEPSNIPPEDPEMIRD